APPPRGGHSTRSHPPSAGVGAGDPAGRVPLEAPAAPPIPLHFPITSTARNRPRNSLFVPPASRRVPQTPEHGSLWIGSRRRPGWRTGRGARGEGQGGGGRAGPTRPAPAPAGSREWGEGTTSSSSFRATGGRRRGAGVSVAWGFLERSSVFPLPRLRPRGRKTGAAARRRRAGGRRGLRGAGEGRGEPRAPGAVREWRRGVPAPGPGRSPWTARFPTREEEEEEKSVCWGLSVAWGTDHRPRMPLPEPSEQEGESVKAGQEPSPESSEPGTDVVPVAPRKPRKFSKLVLLTASKDSAKVAGAKRKGVHCIMSLGVPGPATLAKALLKIHPEAQRAIEAPPQEPEQKRSKLDTDGKEAGRLAGQPAPSTEVVGEESTADAIVPGTVL
uniref:FLYWCH-type zinc finger-containing protein N-terminal domain-containing protein n=2 Tax=Felis catus TaxID=9685 RepID=A0ABI7WIW4_FELCA